jgi:predicted RNA-binding protein YlxR (DUF448 family)
VIGKRQGQEQRVFWNARAHRLMRLRVAWAPEGASQSSHASAVPGRGTWLCRAVVFAHQRSDQ